MRSKKVKLKLFCLADELTSSTSISGDLLFTTVSELILIPDRNHQNQPITCFANNTALEQPIEQQAFLDVQSKFHQKIEIAWVENICVGISMYNLIK